MGTSSQPDSRIPLGAVPDEVFETPLFKMKRFGRYLHIDTSRTKEQHQDLIQRIVKHRPELLARAADIRNELQNLIHRHSSLELLAHLIAKNVWHDPDTYREFDSPLRPHFVEYVALLELEDSGYEYRTLEPPGEDVEKAHALLEELFNTALFHYQTEHISESDGSVPSKLQELRYSAIAHNMAVRSPAYHHHWRDVLIALFSTPAVSAYLASQNLTIADILKCIDASERLMLSRLRNRIEMARKEGEKVRQQVKEMRRSGATSGDTPEILRSLAAQNGRDRKAALNWILSEWAFFDLAGNWSFAIEDLAAEAKIATATAGSFLQRFSIAFGQPREKDPRPRATHELQSKPFISYEGKFMLAAPHLLTWAVKVNIEASLKSEQGALWDSYDQARSKVLVGKAMEYLRGVMPQSSSFQGLFYDFEGKRCELDGLLTFDRYLFLLEGKAGVASAAGRRGAPKSIISDLKDLVRDPANQANRAREFIRKEPTPSFSLKDGTNVPIDKATSTEIVMMSVTLDDLGIFTSDLAEIQKLGLLAEGDLAWAIYLPDLRIITEILVNPSQFLHYVRWRRSLFENDGVLSGKDDVNWLGIYLKEGPEKLVSPPNFDFLTFTTYTTDFDDYFLFKTGQRSKPAVRPAQPMPREMSSLISQLENVGTWGYTRVTDALLDLTCSERKELAKILRRQSKTRSTATSLEGASTLVKLVIGHNNSACEEQARELAVVSSKAAVVLSIAQGSNSLEGWGAASAA